MAETDLTKMTSAELVEALIKDNSLAEEFDHLNLWKAFNSDDWCELLTAQPQFIEKAKEYSRGWVAILQLNPKLAEQCDKWNEFDSWGWCELLSIHPQFADKCNWTEMRADNYDEYDEDEYDDFEYWEEECGEDYSEGWKNLLLKHPRLAEYFTEGLWDEFSQKQWAKLESKHPGVFEDKHMLSTLRKLAK